MRKSEKWIRMGSVVVVKTLDTLVDDNSSCLVTNGGGQILWSFISMFSLLLSSFSFVFLSYLNGVSNHGKVALKSSSVLVEGSMHLLHNGQTFRQQLMSHVFW